MNNKNKLTVIGVHFSKMSTNPDDWDGPTGYDSEGNAQWDWSSEDMVGMPDLIPTRKPKNVEAQKPTPNRRQYS